MFLLVEVQIYIVIREINYQKISPTNKPISDTRDVFTVSVKVHLSLTLTIEV